MILADRIRLPSPIDLEPGAYKDWLHVNVFDVERRAVGVFNLSLHGDPRDRTSLAVGTALLHTRSGGWLSRIEVCELQRASVSPTHIEIPGFMSIGILSDGLQLRVEADGANLDLRAHPTVGAVDVEQQLPFGSGWISWRVEPRMTATGTAVVRGRAVDTTDLVLYHDHNWGRWHWGDDAGWVWAALTGGDATFVLAATTDRCHRQVRPRLWAWLHDRFLSFGPGSVRLGYDGALESAPLRLPGAMAALHGGRSHPRLPARIQVVADDRIDRIEIEMSVEDVCQLITADPARPGYGFIHEMTGPFGYDVLAAGRRFSGSGMGVFEHVD